MSAVIDGIQVPYWMLGSGESAAQCPNNYCGSQVVTVNGQRVITSPFQAYADGRSGYLVPIWQRSDVTIDGVTERGNPTVNWQFNEISYSSTSWGLQLQTQQQTLTIKNIIDEAKRVIREVPSCRDIFAADVDPIKLLEDFEKGIIGIIGFGALQSPPGFTVNATTAPPARGPSTFKINHVGQPIKTVGDISTVNITLNNSLSSPGRERYGLNTLQDRVVTLIHELGHAANFIRNNFANANPTASAILADDITRPSVSQNNSDFVNANCFGPLSRLTQTGGVQ